MVHASKKRVACAVNKFRRQIADQATQALGSVLPSAALHKVLAGQVGPYRERLYPPLTTLGLFIGQALSPDGSCQDAVARALSARTAQGLSECSLNSGPYCKARQRLPLGLIQELAHRVGQRLEQACPNEWRWRGRCVKLVDGTTVSMPDTPGNQHAYPPNGAQQPGLSFPLVMLVAVISLSTGAVLRWASGPCKGKQSGEQALLDPMLDQFTTGQIMLADRVYCTYFMVAQLAQRGVDLVTRQHASRRSDFRRGKRLGRSDHLVQWRRPARPQWMDAQTYANTPAQLTLRETRVGSWILVTTLTDPHSVSPQDLNHLYRQRWQIEVDLRSIKAMLGMDILRARSAAMIEKEIAVYMLAYNLIRALMARAGAQTGLAVRDLSFTGAKQVYLAFEQQLRFAAQARAKTLIAYLLGGISQCTLPKRAARVEPHAIKRRPKNHRLLTVPRDVARAAIRKARRAAMA